MACLRRQINSSNAILYRIVYIITQREQSAQTTPLLLILLGHEPVLHPLGRTQSQPVCTLLFAVLLNLASLLLLLLYDDRRIVNHGMVACLRRRDVSASLRLSVLHSPSVHRALDVVGLIDDPCLSIVVLRSMSAKSSSMFSAVLAETSQHSMPKA